MTIVYVLNDILWNMQKFSAEGALTLVLGSKCGGRSEENVWKYTDFAKTSRFRLQSNEKT